MTLNSWSFQPACTSMSECSSGSDKYVSEASRHEFDDEAESRRTERVMQARDVTSKA